MPANLAGLLRRRDCPRATTGDACGVRLAKAEAAVTRRSLRETGRPRTAECFPVSRRDRLVDRKSTRLNSSHSQISYAVFCLKKKNNQKTKRVSDSSSSQAHA